MVSTQQSEFSRSIDLSLYSRKALAAAQAAYRQYCRVEARPVDNGRLLVTISPLASETDDVRTLILEFWNYFLDCACQEKLS